MGRLGHGFKEFLVEKAAFADGVADLSKLIAALYDSQKFGVVWAQLILVLSCSFERFWTKLSLSNSTTDPVSQCTFEKRVSEIVPGSIDVDERLWQYVEQCKRHSAKVGPCMTFATDKAIPAGCAIQNSVISYPDNVLVICCPQAVQYVR